MFSSRTKMIAVSVFTIFAMFFSLFPTGLAQAADSRSAAQDQNIVQVAVAINSQTGEFSTLIAALKAADLVTTLSGNGPFTVFAPSDAAFAALGLNADNVASLGKEKLTNILLYHVASGNLQAADVAAVNHIQMLNHECVKVHVNGQNVFINNAKVVQANVAASNGVIHVIDQVLMP